tara:strand:+ start:181 stop:339 length:159 start_codon:yes stop_codon:yes gene_type:complete
MAEPIEDRIVLLEQSVMLMQEMMIALSKQIEELKKHTFQDDEIEEEKDNGKS